MKNTSKELRKQLNSLYRHCRKESYQTRRRYKSAGDTFCDYIGEYFGLEKLANMSIKHIAAYVVYMQEERDLAASTILTNLSALRLWHGEISCTKHPFPSNDELSVELKRRKYAGIDRAWTQDEVDRLIAVALDCDRLDYAVEICLAYELGLRIHEVLKIDTQIANNALTTGKLRIKGKGGKVREVPLTDNTRSGLKVMLKKTERGSKLFVPDDVETHRETLRLEAFIREHRDECLDAGDTRKLTFHGLRHSFAANMFRDETERKGVDAHIAKLRVSNALGHNREDVTDLYISSVKKDAEDPK